MKKIKLSKGKYALVDNEDFDFINKRKWFFDGRKAARTEYGHNIFLHRILMKAPKDLVVDHVNHNPLDNRRLNLRICTKSNNQHNRNPNRSTNKTSIYKGVSIKKEGYIRAHITVKTKHIHLGYFKTIKEAALAYNEAAQKYFGEFACLNKLNGK